LGLGFGVWGLGFGVWGLGFGVWGLGFGVFVGFDDFGVGLYMVSTWSLHGLYMVSTWSRCCGVACQVVDVGHLDYTLTISFVLVTAVGFSVQVSVFRS